MTRGQSRGVQLSGAASASQMLHQIMSTVAGEYQAEFKALPPPTAERFRKQYIDFVPRFEAARAASPRRAEIARRLASLMASHLSFGSEQGESTLCSWLADNDTAPSIAHRPGRRTSAWTPRPVYKGETWTDLQQFSEKLIADDVMNVAAGEALAWLQDHCMSDGRLSLVGRKVAVLGAAAEMAPTRLLLEAGADVLWCDLGPPPEDLLKPDSTGGDLCWLQNGSDLLNRPHEIAPAITRFSNGQPVDVCLFAYAPGQAREIRLTGAMNAIIDALPRPTVGSVSMLLSPTTATPLGAADLVLMARRLQNRPAWEGALAHAGLLGSGGGFAGAGESGASRTVVSIQGSSYQAAQYLGKLMAAESWSQGADESGTDSLLRVSANTAAITRTRSMDHPVFDAAFEGAAAFGIETFVPAQSRTINGLLMVHDWLNETPPTPGAIRVHGGIHTLPYRLESALRVAAAIGFARSPGLLTGLLRREGA